MPDLAAYEQAARLPFPAVVQQLSGLLGAKLVAYLSGVRETNAVRQWGNGVSNAQAPIPQRLRLALQVAMLIAQHDSPRVVQAWFQGLNPQLEDRSPARRRAPRDRPRADRPRAGGARASGLRAAD